LPFGKLVMYRCLYYHAGLLRLQQIYQSLRPGKESFQVESVKRIQNISEAIDYLHSLEELSRWVLPRDRLHPQQLYHIPIHSLLSNTTQSSRNNYYNIIQWLDTLQPSFNYNQRSHKTCISYLKDIQIVHTRFYLQNIVSLDNFLLMFTKYSMLEKYRLLGYSAVYILCEPTFRRNVSPPSSG
jgi:hypothetical protein